jgi:hypothetical protein
LDALRERLGLHERLARDFLDALVALGFLGRRDGVYRNTAATDLFLDKRRPSYLGGIVEMANHPLYGFWGSLTEGLRTGRLQNEAKTGDIPFSRLYADPARLPQSLAAMTGLRVPTTTWTQALDYVRGRRWTRVEEPAPPTTRPQGDLHLI